MRIIDKNTDYYDYIQNIYRDDTLTFDRRDSFLLTKEMVCKNINLDRYSFRYQKNKDYKDQKFILLQICNTFWLFLLTVTETKKYLNTEEASDYDLELITTWKNFYRKRVLCELNIIHLGYAISKHFLWGKNIWRGKDAYGIDALREEKDLLIQAVNSSDCKIAKPLHEYTQYKDYKGNYDKTQKTIPLLKACGIANLVDPMDIFLSFEEYFSLEKTDSERREPIGATNNDKIESHGFDTKTSFRGKTV